MRDRTPQKRGRPAGQRNADYEATRAALLARCRAHLMRPEGTRASFRELAAAAEVSVPTLRHYFGSRAELLEAVMDAALADGLSYLQEVAAGPLPPLAESLRWFLGFLAAGLAQGVDALHTFGLAQGLADEVVGPAYVEKVLEPTLRALEARLERHMARGEMRPSPARSAALELVSPLLLARLHQGPLGGSRCRELDERALARDVLEAFLRAHARD